MMAGVVRMLVADVVLLVGGLAFGWPLMKAFGFVMLVGGVFILLTTLELRHA